MSIVYVISDTHFGHPGVRFIPGRKEVCGQMTPEEHDEFLIDNWNSVVTKRDVVIHLGDVGYDRPSGYFVHGIFPRLAGRKYVVGGNHDTPNILRPFEKINGVITRGVKGHRVVLTHIPIHPQEAYWDLNIHGHLHAGKVKSYAFTTAQGKTGTQTDPRYVCVCVEHTGFAPVPLEDVVVSHMERWGAAIAQFPRDRIRR